MYATDRGTQQHHLVRLTQIIYADVVNMTAHTTTAKCLYQDIHVNVK